MAKSHHREQRRASARRRRNSPSSSGMDDSDYGSRSDEAEEESGSSSPSSSPGRGGGRRGRTERRSYRRKRRSERQRLRSSCRQRRRRRYEEPVSDSDEDSGDDRRRSNSSASGSRRKRKPSRDITEEEILEYLAKKRLRKAEKVAKKLKEKFVWRKKIARDVTQGLVLDMLSLKVEKRRQKERMAEIEKLKKRRAERAIQKAQREEEMAMLARKRARAEFQDWEKKEEEFHFQQSKIRSEIRLREGREKPIDLLLRNLNGSKGFDGEPCTVVFRGLTVKEMEELRVDIRMHVDLDRATPTRIQFWKAMMVVCNWELAEARKRDAIDRARVQGEDPPAEVLAEERGIPWSIEADVRKLLERKTLDELEALQWNIESQMLTGAAKVVEFWEAILKRLPMYEAKACLKGIHLKP